MKTNCILPCLLVLCAACQTAAPGNGKGQWHPSVATPPQWTGTYADTLPCADCPGIFTRLDLRPDSTYVLRELYLERDSIPFGTIGTWRSHGDRLTLNTFGDPLQWRWAGDSLQRLGPGGEAISTSLPNAVRRVPSLQPSAMHLTGGYFFQDGSHSFTPCGTTLSFPVLADPVNAPGPVQQLDQTYVKEVKEAGRPLYVQITATIRSGPAMEGDGTQEYIQVDQVDGLNMLQGCR